MEKLQTRQQIKKFAFLAVAVYMISYMTRINFGAIVTEMERATGIGKSQLSMSLTGSFVTYGLGQILCGILGDRVSPKRMIACGLGLTTGMNFCSRFVKMNGKCWRFGVLMGLPRLLCGHRWYGL